MKKIKKIQWVLAGLPNRRGLQREPKAACRICWIGDYNKGGRPDAGLVQADGSSGSCPIQLHLAKRDGSAACSPGMLLLAIQDCQAEHHQCRSVDSTGPPVGPRSGEFEGGGQRCRAYAPTGAPLGPSVPSEAQILMFHQVDLAVIPSRTMLVQ